MAEIILKDVQKIYPGGSKALHGIDLHIKDKEFMVFVGPSGCGKSTTLRIIAGLEDISAGELYIGDRLANDIPSKDRDISMVFQNYALYPHMTVKANMEFALKLRKTPHAEIKEKIDYACGVLGLEEYLARKPSQLSGGQRQRVALGRAMVKPCEVFLLDEPLSNLDAKLRTSARAEITALHRRLGVTFIYVTHDQTEAMTMGDRIAVMRDGLIEQLGTPAEVYGSPANLFVAGFIGSPRMNFVRGEVEKRGSDLYIKSEVFEFRAGVHAPAALKNYVGREVVLGIRPEQIAVGGAPRTPAHLPISLEYISAEPLGFETLVHYGAGEGENFTARVFEDGAPGAADFKNSKTYFNSDRVHMFCAETERNILFDTEEPAES